MAKPLAVDVKVDFVLLPEDRRAAWDYGISLIGKFEQAARLEVLEAENRVARDCRGQLTESSGTPMEGEQK